MPLCFGASGSVRTNVSSTSASCAPDVHTFCPLTTKLSPSRTARVRSDARSEPAPGSLIPSDAVISARRIGTAHLRCCSPRAERDQRGGDDADALWVEGQVDPSAREFQLVDVLLQDRGVAAAELGRISGEQPAVVEHQPLPATRPFRDMATRPRALERLGFRRQVLVQKCDELGAERLDVGVEGQLHGAPSRIENWKDFCYHQNENTILIVRKLQSLTRWPRGGRGPQWQGVLRYSQFMFSPIGQHPSRR